LSLLPLVFGGPLILTPALIAFLEMIIDPACSVVFEAEKEEDNVMLRPPRDPQSTLLNRSLVATSLSLGALAFLAVGTVFVIARGLGGSESDLRTLALVSLVTTNIALIFAHRSFDTSARAVFGRPNRWLWFGVAGVAASLIVVLATPVLREVFRLAPLHADDIALSFTAAAVFVVTAWGLRHLALSSQGKRRQV
jgi:Ca2+-transporting ATPase